MLLIDYYMEKDKHMRILFFGTGKAYQNNKKWFVDKNTEIVGFLDNDSKKQYKMLDNIEIFSPNDINKINFDIIYVMGKYEKEMRKQLLQLGVDENRIHNKYNLQVDCYHNKEYTNITILGEYKKIYKMISSSEKNKVLLISNDLYLMGGQIVFLYLAESLQKLGYDIIVASPINGPLLKQYMKRGIPVIIDDTISIASLDKIEWVAEFSMIWINTIWGYSLLRNNVNKVPIIWWLHESKMFFENVDINLLKKINDKNLSIYSVSDIADKAFKKYIPTVITNLLPYGIPDFYEKKETKNEDKLIFAIVGGICKRKAQDIFIEASKRLRHEYKNQVEFWIVGNYDNEFARDILEPVKKIDNIKILGELNREEIPNMYRNISVLVCPSYEDPLPVVTVEAMMNYKPCIVSTGVGTAKYIANDKAGFIIPTGDSDALYQKMKWFMEHRSAIKEMGINARNIYSKNFSMKEFENRVKKIMSDRLK